MPLGTAPELLHADHSTDVLLARLTPDRLDSSNVEAFGRRLNELAEAAKHKHVRLDMAAVRYLSSEPLGKLVAFHTRVRAAGGQLLLDNVQPLVHEVMEATQLTRIFSIRRAASRDVPSRTRSA
jgi:anti-anti-sigma factor